MDTPKEQPKREDIRKIKPPELVFTAERSVLTGKFQLHLVVNNINSLDAISLMAQGIDTLVANMKGGLKESNIITPK